MKKIVKNSSRICSSPVTSLPTGMSKTSSHDWEIFIPFRFRVFSGSLVQLRGKRFPNSTTASMLQLKYSIEIYQFGSWMQMAKISLHLLLSLLLLVIKYLLISSKLIALLAYQFPAFFLIQKAMRRRLSFWVKVELAIYFRSYILVCKIYTQNEKKIEIRKFLF